MTRLGTWMPFGRVPAELLFFTQTSVSAETARRATEGAGAALVAVQTGAVEQLERDLPEPPAGPAVQQLSADGAMVPLLDGEWAEVKTLILGSVGARSTRGGERVAQTTNLTYFSRLTDAEQFGRLATIATHAAGTATAGTVCAVVDGAEWLQGFIALHRWDAVRIPGTRVRVFPHAAEHLSTAVHAVFGPGTPAATAWLDQQLHELKHGDPDVVLAALADLPATTPEAQKTRATVVAYLVKRRSQIAYADFRAKGYPIGDGAVESANKLVVEHRLKGSGMHWKRTNVNPMVALRAAACSDQWAATWDMIGTRRRDQEREHRRLRCQTRRARREAAGPTPTVELTEPAELAEPASPLPVSVDPPLPPREKLVVDGRPTENHPWRRFNLSPSHHVA